MAINSYIEHRMHNKKNFAYITGYLPSEHVLPRVLGWQSHLKSLQ